jgi:uncharacterized protein (TIGR02391 family)
MSDATAVLSGIEKLREELLGIAQAVEANENTTVAFDRHRRWKKRAVPWLRENVSASEAEGLDGPSGGLSLMDPMGNVLRQLQADDSYLATLADEIREHPEAVIPWAGAPDWSALQAPEGLHQAARHLRLNARIVEATRHDLEAGHYRQAVAEAGTAILTRLKELSGISDQDGAKLVSSALFGDRPKLLVNPLSSLAQKDEQTGLGHLALGYILGLHNPCTHDQQWPMEQIGALQALTTAGPIMDKLDKARLK